MEVTEGGIRFNARITLPYAPFIGTLGVSPEIEAVTSLQPDYWGGNMDLPDVGPGAIAYFPVHHKEAYLYLGDCHATQGDGELCGIGAIEIRTQTTVRLDLVPKPRRMVWPRIETDEHIGAIACARPLEDAFRLASEELVNWMVDDFGFSPEGAVLLLGQVAEARCTQLANPKYTYITKIAKRYI